MRTAFALLVPLAAADEYFDALFKDDFSQIDHELGVVTGELPSYLAGQYAHNGCGSFGMGNRVFTHIFDCYGKLHSWDFAGDGTAKVTTRMLTTPFLAASEELGDIQPQVFTGRVEPGFNEKQKVEALMNSKPCSSKDDKCKYPFNAAVNLWEFDGVDGLVATTDSAFLLEVNRESLDAAPFEFDNLAFGKNWSIAPAHPQKIPGSSGSVLLGMQQPNPMRTAVEMTIYVQAGGTHVERLALVELDRMPYIHSFAVTENYVVVIAYPATFHPMCVLKSTLPGFKGVSECFSWDGDSMQSTAYVFALSDGELVAKVSGPARFTFHQVNAYEADDGTLVLDGCEMSDSTILQSQLLARDVLADAAKRNAYYEDYMGGHTKPSLARWTIDLSKGPESTALHQILPVRAADGAEYAFDFPVVHPAVAGRKHCLVWGVSGPFAGGDAAYEATAVIKVNVCDSREAVLVYKPPAHHYATGDPSFVPAPSGAEDEGVLLSHWTDMQRNSTYLLVLDAKTLAVRATVYPKTPFKMPFGFHGRWVAATQGPLVV